MKSINVDGLPDPIIRSLTDFVERVRQHLEAPDQHLTPEQRLERAAGSWADCSDELDSWLDAMHQCRKRPRPEVVQ